VADQSKHQGHLLSLGNVGVEALQPRSEARVELTALSKEPRQRIDRRNKEGDIMEQSGQTNRHPKDLDGQEASIYPFNT
jgi:hypothetical protein